MVQYAEPNSTVTQGNWSLGGGADNCHDATDCNTSPPTPDDTEYVTIDGDDGGGYFEVGLETVSTPSDPSACSVYLRERVLGGGGGPEKLDAYLYEGATLRATLWTNYALTDNSFNTDTITPVDLSAVTDWSNLSVRIDVDTLGSGEDAQISMILLETPDASAEVNVDCTAGALTIAGYNPEVEAGVTVACTAGAVSVLGYNVDVIPTIVVSCGIGALSIVGYSVEVEQGVTIDCTLGAMTLAGYNATVEATVTISCTAGVISLVGYDVEIPHIIECAAGALAIAGQNVEVEQVTAINCTAGAVTITGYNVTVQATVTVACTAGALTIAGYGPEVEVGTTVSCATGALVIAGYGVEVEAGTSISAGVGALSIVGHSVSIVKAPIETGGPFVIDADTGEITIDNPSQLAIGQTWEVVVRVTDAAAQTDDGTITIELVSAPISVIGPLINGGLINAAPINMDGLIQ